MISSHVRQVARLDLEYSTWKGDGWFNPPCPSGFPADATLSSSSSSFSLVPFFPFFLFSMAVFFLFFVSAASFVFFGVGATFLSPFAVPALPFLFFVAALLPATVSTASRTWTRRFSVALPTRFEARDANGASSLSSDSSSSQISANTNFFETASSSRFLPPRLFLFVSSSSLPSPLATSDSVSAGDGVTLLAASATSRSLVAAETRADRLSDIPPREEAFTSRSSSRRRGTAVDSSRDMTIVRRSDGL